MKKNLGIFISVCFILSFFVVSAQNFSPDLGARLSYNNIEHSSGLIVNQKGIITSSTLQAPRFQGYIIQFKEEPVLKRKVKLEKEVVEAVRRSEAYKIEAEQINTSGIGVIKTPIKIIKELRSDKFKKISENRKKEILDKLKEHKSKILDEHKNALEDIKSKISRITGNTIDEENKNLMEYTNTFNGVFLNVSSSEVEEIKKSDYVKEVYPNYEVNITLMDSVPLINADDVWLLDKDGNSCASSGKECLTGENVTIAIIDTGVDYIHDDLGGCLGVGCKVVGGYDFVNNDNDPMDDYGHGTHCAAIAAGKGVLKGVAPEAKIYAYKVLNAYGSGYWDDIIAAIERAVDPNNDSNFSDHVDVISMSLGGPGNPDDALSQAVDTAVENGVVAVIAAGNDGPRESTIGSPGTARKAITVGASDKNDIIAYFSSRGPVIWEDEDGNSKAIIKPDVVAPGVNICAAQYDSAWDDRKCFDDEHIAISGTSMATPHVAGAAALIKQAHPDWTPEEIKMALRSTAIDINEEITTKGYGRIDVEKAVGLKNSGTVTLLEPSGIVSGTVSVEAIINVSNFLRYTLKVKESNGEWKSIIVSTTLPADTHLGDLDTTKLNGGDTILKLEVETTENNVFTDALIFKTENFLISQIGNEYNYAINSQENIIAKVNSGNYVRYDLEIDQKGKQLSYFSYHKQLQNGVVGEINTDNFSDDTYQLKIIGYTADGVRVESVPFKFIILKDLRGGIIKELPIYSTTFGNPSIWVNDVDNDKKNEILFRGEERIDLGGGWYTSNGVINIIKNYKLFQQIKTSNDCGGIFDYLVYNNTSLFLIDAFGNYQDTTSEGSPYCYFRGSMIDNNGKEKWNYVTKRWGGDIFNLQESKIWGIGLDNKKEILSLLFHYNWEDNPTLWSKNEEVSLRIFDDKGFLKELNNKPFVNLNFYSAGGLFRLVPFSNKNYIGVLGIKHLFNQNGDLFTNLINFKVYNLLENTSTSAVLESAGVGGYIGNLVQPIMGDLDEDGEIETIFSFYYVNSSSETIYTKIYIADSEGNIKKSFKVIDEIIVPEIFIQDKKEKFIVAKNVEGWKSRSSFRYDILLIDKNGDIVKRIPSGSYRPVDSSALRAIDVDNDGKSELIVGLLPLSWRGESSLIRIYSLDGTILKEIKIPTFKDVQNIRDFALFDVDKDGKVELIVLTDSLDLNGCTGICFPTQSKLKLLVFKLDITLNYSELSWPMYMHNPQHTGCYDCEKPILKNCSETYNNFAGEFGEFCNVACGNDTLVSCPLGGGNYHVAVCQRNVSSGECSKNKSAVCQNGEWINCSQGCENGVCIQPKGNVTNTTCIDTDGGKNYYVAGEVVLLDGKKRKDMCSSTRTSSDYLIEWSCSLTGLPQTTGYVCPYGCVDGECIQDGNITCIDTDGGKNYYEVGRAWGNYENHFINNTDTCLTPNWHEINSGDYLGEFYCDENELKIEHYFCPKGCQDGACVQFENQTINCKESDGGINYDVQGVACIGSTCRTDYCLDSKMLIEYYVEDNDANDGICSLSTDIFSQKYNCKNGCENGACIEQPTNAICVDSDNGKGYYTKGKISYTNSPQGILEEFDICDIGNMLVERVCVDPADNSKNFIKYKCPNGCQDGACVSEPLVANCTEDISFSGCSSSYCTNKGYIYSGCERKWIKTGWFGQGHYVYLGHCKKTVNSGDCSGDNTKLCENGSWIVCFNGCQDGACLKSGISGSVIKANKFIEWIKKIF